MGRASSAIPPATTRGALQRPWSELPSQWRWCETGPGTYYYRGERLSDGTNIELVNAVASSGGFDVTNPVDGTRYEVRPDRLTIISNGHVDSSEPVVQYASG